jgi:hypothetical protein
LEDISDDEEEEKKKKEKEQEDRQTEYDLSRKKSYNCICGDCDNCKEVLYGKDKEALSLSKTNQNLVDYSSDKEEDHQRCPSKCGGCSICLLEEDECLEVEEELKKKKVEKVHLEKREEEKIRKKETMEAKEEEEKIRQKEKMMKQAEQFAAKDCTCEDCVFCFDKYAIRKTREMKGEKDLDVKKLNLNFKAEECNRTCILKFSPADCSSCHEEEEDHSEIMHELTKMKKKRRENQRREDMRMRLDPNYEKGSACPDGNCGGCNNCLRNLPSGLLTTKISLQELEKNNFRMFRKSQRRLAMTHLFLIV